VDEHADRFWGVAPAPTPTRRGRLVLTDCDHATSSIRVIGLRGKQSRDVNDRDDRFGVERRGPPNNRNGDEPQFRHGRVLAKRPTASEQQDAWNSV